MGIKQPLYVNGKIFNSINKAAKFLRISVSTLADRLRDKEATVYKDILIEKAKKEPKSQPKLLKRKGIPVLVDGVMYDSMNEAERAIGLGENTLSHAVRRNGSYCKGHKIELINPEMLSKRLTRNSVKVYNKTEDKMFDSIVDAAKYADADEWTMSRKLEVDGGYIDRNGNEYIRLNPMKTKNVYKKTGKSCKQREYKPKFENRMQGCIDLNDIKFNDCVVEEKPKKDEVPQIVKDAINEKIVGMLKEKGLYEDIVNLLNYGGFSTIKITKE